MDSADNKHSHDDNLANLLPPEEVYKEQQGPGVWDNWQRNKAPEGPGMPFVARGENDVRARETRSGKPRRPLLRTRSYELRRDSSRLLSAQRYRTRSDTTQSRLSIIENAPTQHSYELSTGSTNVAATPVCEKPKYQTVDTEPADSTPQETNMANSKNKEVGTRVETSSSSTAGTWALKADSSVWDDKEDEYLEAYDLAGTRLPPQGTLDNADSGSETGFVSEGERESETDNVVAPSDFVSKDVDSVSQETTVLHRRRANTSTEHFTLNAVDIQTNFTESPNTFLTYIKGLESQINERLSSANIRHQEEVAQVQEHHRTRLAVEQEHFAETEYELRSRLAAKSAEIEELIEQGLSTIETSTREQIAIRDKEILRLKEQLIELETEKRELNASVAFNKSQFLHSANKAVQFESALKVAERQLKEKEETIARTRKDRDIYADKYAVASEKYKMAKGKIGQLELKNNDIEGYVESYEQDNIVLLAEIKGLKEQIKDLEEQTNDLREQIDRMHEALDVLQPLEEEKEELKAKVTDLQGKIVQKDTQLSMTEALQSEKQELLAQVGNLKAKVQLLEGMPKTAGDVNVEIEDNFSPESRDLLTSIADMRAKIAARRALPPWKPYVPKSKIRTPEQKEADRKLAISLGCFVDDDHK